MLYYVGRKDPDAVLDYPLDWAGWLGADSIASATVTSDPGITASVSFSGAVTVVRLTGGTDGQSYRATVRVTTAGGETEEHTLLVRVSQSTAPALPAAQEVRGMLPDDTAVAEADVSRFLDSAVGRLAANHGGALPVTEETRDLAERLAFARALKLHYLKGEGYLDTPGVDKEIDRVEAAFALYDEENISSQEEEAEVPTAKLSRIPW